MKKFVRPRLALMLSAAVLVVAACSTEGPIRTIVAPEAVSADHVAGHIGISTGALMTVCIAPPSPAGNYDIAITGVTGVISGDTQSSSPLTLASGTCGQVIVKGNGGQNSVTGAWPSAFATLTVSSANAGTYSFTCLADDGTLGHCSATAGNTNTVQAGVSNPHGSLVNFILTPPPATSGCTYTHGWFKNRGNSTVPITPFFGLAGAGPLTWRQQIAMKSSAYDKLAYQYIAAKLSVGTATPPLAVAAALVSAEAFFAGRVQNTGTPPAGVATTLDFFVNGGYAGWPHCG